MKIAITVSQITPGGGLSKYICTLADILTSHYKNEVWIITTHTSETNANLEHLSGNRNIKYFPLGDKSLLKKYISLICLLRKFSPDIIINNYNAPVQFVLPFLSRKSRVIHILHNNTPDFYRVAAINGRFVDRWIAPTPALADYFNRYTDGKYRDRVVTIPHGVDDPICDPSKNPILPQLTYVGVLYEHKGVKILPQVIKKLLRRNLKFHFTIIGDGILREELEDQLRDEIGNKVVEFTGKIPSEEVYLRLSQSDVFVYPTHIDAFGLVIAEAMINSAIPVITHLPGITDTLVDDQVNGYLLPQDDVDMFVERISQLINDEPLRRELSTAAAKKALKCFSHKVMEINYMNFITDLIAK